MQWTLLLELPLTVMSIMVHLTKTMQMGSVTKNIFHDNCRQASKTLCEKLKCQIMRGCMKHKLISFFGYNVCHGGMTQMFI